VSSIGFISVKEKIFIEIAYKSLGIRLGDVAMLWIEWHMCEGPYNLLILKLSYKKDIMFLIDSIVEINVAHIFKVIY
jgi:hypothetical protein